MEIFERKGVLLLVKGVVAEVAEQIDVAHDGIANGEVDICDFFN